MYMSADQDSSHMRVSPDQNGSLCDGQIIMSHKSSAAVTLPNLGSFAPHPTDDCDPAAHASCHMRLALLSERSLLLWQMPNMRQCGTVITQSTAGILILG